MYDMVRKALFVWHFLIKEYFHEFNEKMKYEVNVFNEILSLIITRLWTCFYVVSVFAEELFVEIIFNNESLDFL